MKYPTEEELNTEDVRINLVIEKMQEWSDLHEKMNSDYIGHIAGLQKERREMFKYIGTVAAGAAALAPQLLDEVHQKDYFYLGVSLLFLVVAIALTYVLSTLENESGALSKDLRKKNQRIDDVRKPLRNFLSGSDYSIMALKEAIAKEKKATENLLIELSKESPSKKDVWFPRMDYTGEFIILFFTGGIIFIVLSLISFHLKSIQLLYISLGIFTAINIFSTFPVGVFKFLGVPIDGVKWVVRLLVSGKWNQSDK